MMTIDIDMANGTILHSVPIAGTFSERLLGLMFNSSSVYPNGMYFNGCNCIHTCFMRYEIDVFFMDSNGVICREFRKVGPWRVCSGGSGAMSVLETRAGLLPGLETGIKLTVPQTR